MINPSDFEWKAISVIGGVIAVAAVVGLQVVGIAPLDLQFMRSCGEFLHAELVNHLGWDFVFIVGYTALFLGWFGLRLGSSDQPSTLMWMPVALAIADSTENVLTWAASSTCVDAESSAGLLGDAVYGAAMFKWVLVGAVVVVALWLVGKRPLTPPDPPTTTFDPEARGGVGISCSGGGIRSASFSLGALHGLGSERVRSANYLAAVSGGGYTAAGMTMHARSQDPADAELPFSPGSPELRRLRSKTSYLALNGQDGRVGVGRMLATMALNLLILYLVVFALGRPLGWVIQSDVLHPELRSSAPLVHKAALGSVPEIPRSEVSPVKAAKIEKGMAQEPCASDGPFDSYWELTFRAAYVLSHETRQAVTSTSIAAIPADPMQVLPGHARVCAGQLEVVTSPTLLLPDGFLGGLGDPLRPDMFVQIQDQPLLAVETDLDEDDLDEEDLDEADLEEADLEEADLERLRQAVEQSITLAREPSVLLTPSHEFRSNITIDIWMWAVVSVLLAPVIGALAFNRKTRLGKVGGTLQLAPIWTGFFVVGSAAAVVLVVAPWLVQEVPRIIGKLPDWLPGVDGGEATTTPFQWIVSALAAGGIGRAAASRLLEGVSKTKQGLQLLLKVAAFLLLAIAAILMAVGIVQQASLNGPLGVGSADAEAWHVRLGIPDMAWWGVIVLALLVLKDLLPAQAWSMNPLYRDRLAAAFLGHGKGDEAITPQPVPKRGAAPPGDAATELSAKTLWELKSDTPEPETGDPVQPWPELVICCTANFNDLEWDAIPSRRWATSFTFSPSQIGSPSLGYWSTTDYLASLSERRQADLAVASLVATSGAAISSAMGKHALGAIGGLLATLNVRLGLWLPNPLAVNGDRPFSANPGWPYLLGEVFGKFSPRKPFVYITDGGHWENLGFVELLRRRCTEIYVFSAAGDGVDFFPTLGEALALAREETGIEVNVELTPLRKQLRDAPANTERELVRESDGGLKTQDFARKPFVVGWWAKEIAGVPTRGRVMFVEANLTSDMPWDVHAFAEKNPVFPDHSTGDQFFSNETFEAYRRLGEYQVQAGVASLEWHAAGLYADDLISGPTLKAMLSELQT